MEFLNFLKTPIFSKVFLVAQIVVSTFLIIVILFQGRGAEVSGIFGGSSGVYRTKRGIEKFLYIATIVLAVLFIVLGILNLIASQQ